MKKKKMGKFELWSISGVALVIIAVIAVYCSYHYISKINAYSALVPTTVDSGQQSSTDEMVLYQNIDKTKYGKYDYIQGVRGELIVQLKPRVPLYRIAEIAGKYGLRVESRYNASLPSFILRIIDPGDDIGKMRIVDPGDDIGKMRLVDPGDDIASITAGDLRNQGFSINPNVLSTAPVSSGYLENIWRQLVSNPDVYSVTLNTVK